MKTITNVSAGGIRPAEYAVVKISIRTKTVIEIRRTIRRKTCFFFLGKGKQTAENKHERRVCNRVVFGRHVRTTETAGNGGRWKKRFETRPTTTNGSAEWIRRVPSSFVFAGGFSLSIFVWDKKTIATTGPDRNSIQTGPNTTDPYTTRVFGPCPAKRKCSQRWQTNRVRDPKWLHYFWRARLRSVRTMDKLKRRWIYSGVTYLLPNKDEDLNVKNKIQTGNYYK